LGLLEAFAQVLVAGIDAELVLVGDGTEKKNIERMLNALGLNDKVRLTGMLSEHSTLAEIAGADVLAITSFMEGLPVVLIEAMGMGLPVVATRVAGIPELVVDGRNGFLFSPANWDELAEHLSRLLKDIKLQRRLGDAGRLAALRSHDAQNAFDPLIKYFRNEYRAL
jgi:glycosyltransferase involved in cell wall biosynthesis